MILSDYHVHTCYCHGENTPEEMVISAINMGMKEIGLLAHSDTFFDDSYCLPHRKYTDFIDEITRLKEKFSGKIKISCGVEQDYYSTVSTDGFDYVIGSVHYLEKAGKYYPLDFSIDHFADMVKECYNGDFYLLAEDYFDKVSLVAEKTGADIIGHLDLITKFNEQTPLFDDQNERYLAAAKKCIDVLIPYGKPFEINTGAISRGYRTTPYPSSVMIDYIKEKSGKLILSSDAHNRENIAYQFDKWEELL
ncbi:MAG: histidinol-phosphatase [Monoglobales bacterium]